MKITDTHIYFWGSVYSNWYLCKFTVDGIEFNCSEQFLMYSKAKLFNDSEFMSKILKEENPRIQKSLGRLVRNFDKDIWDLHCFDIMKTGLLAKCRQNNHVLQQILDTGNRIFVEGSPYDTIWGVGLHFEDESILDEANWKGLNLLGKALTEVRDQLKSEENNGVQ